MWTPVAHVDSCKTHVDSCGTHVDSYGTHVDMCSHDTWTSVSLSRKVDPASQHLLEPFAAIAQNFSLWSNQCWSLANKQHNSEFGRVCNSGDGRL